MRCGAAPHPEPGVPTTSSTSWKRCWSMRCHGLGSYQSTTGREFTREFVWTIETCSDREWSVSGPGGTQAAGACSRRLARCSAGYEPVPCREGHRRAAGYGPPPSSRGVALPHPLRRARSVAVRGVKRLGRPVRRRLRRLRGPRSGTAGVEPVERGHQLRLTVGSVERLECHATSRMAATSRIHQLNLKVRRWRQPQPSWSGRLGPLPGLVSWSVRLPPSGSGTARGSGWRGRCHCRTRCWRRFPRCGRTAGCCTRPPPS